MTAISPRHAGKPNFQHFDRRFAPTVRLRTEGTDHLIAAAEAAGVPHVVAQSYADWNGLREGGWVKTEDDPLDPLEIQVSIEEHELNGQPGAIFRDREGRVLNTWTVDVLDGRIQAIRTVLNPEKLGHVGPVATPTPCCTRRARLGGTTAEPRSHSPTAAGRCGCPRTGCGGRTCA